MIVLALQLNPPENWRLSQQKEREREGGRVKRERGGGREGTARERKGD